MDLVNFFPWHASELWTLVQRASWNPLCGAIIGGIFGGIFALIGAIIGGRYVLRSVAEARRFDRLAAGRALSVELDLNVASTATLSAVGRAKTEDYLTFRPLLIRAVFDSRLALFSELLSAPQFYSLVSLYARASASFSLLETEAKRGAPFSRGAVEKFKSLAEEFAIAARQVATYVWSEEEQKRLELIRGKSLSEAFESRGLPTDWQW